jgi:hypothetical protein
MKTALIASILLAMVSYASAQGTTQAPSPTEPKNPGTMTPATSASAAEKNVQKRKAKAAHHASGASAAASK